MVVAVTNVMIGAPRIDCCVRIMGGAHRIVKVPHFVNETFTAVTMSMTSNAYCTALGISPD